jgi:hypothetical protein
MAKIRYPPFDVDSAFTLLVHFGPGGARAPGTWHLIHEYGPADQYLLALGWALSWSSDLNTQFFAARDLVALPAIPRDFCPICYNFISPGFLGPAVPRMNIYHGESREIIPPAFHWDWFDPDPPPGFSWTP